VATLPREILKSYSSSLQNAIGRNIFRLGVYIESYNKFT